MVPSVRSRAVRLAAPPRCLGVRAGCWAVALLALVPLAVRAQADADGQTYLDRAIEARLAASSPDDLGDVIALCQMALDKGLDPANTEFCSRMLAATLLQRATVIVEAKLFADDGPDPRWDQWRLRALADLERALKHDDKLAAAHALLGRLNLLPGGDRKLARESLDRAIELAADDDETRGRAYGYRANLEDNLEKRLADLDRSIELVAGDADTWRARGAVKLALQRPKEALPDLDEAIRLAPQQAPTHELRGLCLAMLERYDESKKSLDEAQRLAPRSVSVYLQRARVSFALGDRKATIADATAALDIDPQNVMVLLLRAQALHLENRDAEALADAELVLRIEPENRMGRRVRALLLATTGRTAEAATELERLRDEQPKDGEILLQLAMVYNAEKRIDDAVAALDAAIAAAPKSVAALRARGDLRLGQGKLREAVADYEAALALEPRDSGVLNNLAWLLCTAPDRSVRDGQRAVKLATTACEETKFQAPHILSTLAAGHAELGQWDEALRFVDEALKLADEPPLKEQLGKERAAYEAHKPWREFKGEGGPEGAAAQPPAAGDKPADAPDKAAALPATEKD